MMNKLTKLTGKKIEKPLDLYYLYHTFVAESFMNLTLPRWANDYFPDGSLFNGIVTAYNIANSTPLLKKLYAGKSHIQRSIVITPSFYSALLIFYRPNNSCHIGKHGRTKCEFIEHENLFI